MCTVFAGNMTGSPTVTCDGELHVICIMLVHVEARKIKKVNKYYLTLY